MLAYLDVTVEGGIRFCSIISVVVTQIKTTNRKTRQELLA